MKSQTAQDFFLLHFNGQYDELKDQLREIIFSNMEMKEKAQKIKKICGKPKKLPGESRNSYRRPISESNNSNINITINESGSNVWDYLLLSSIFSNNSQQQPIIINNIHSARSSDLSDKNKTSSKKDKDTETNKLLFLFSLCVITHLMVCALYNLYFKKEAEKDNKPIDYLANRQRDISIFQLLFGVASFIIAGMSISDSSVFVPFLINTFICLGSSIIFSCAHNNTMKNEVEPYIELVKLITIDALSPPSYAESTQNNHHTAPNPNPTAPYPTAPYPTEGPNSYTKYPHTGHCSYKEPSFYENI